MQEESIAWAGTNVPAVSIGMVQSLTLARSPSQPVTGLFRHARAPLGGAYARSVFGMVAARLGLALYQWALWARAASSCDLKPCLALQLPTCFEMRTLSGGLVRSAPE